MHISAHAMKHQDTHSPIAQHARRSNIVWNQNDSIEINISQKNKTFPDLEQTIRLPYLTSVEELTVLSLDSLIHPHTHLTGTHHHHKRIKAGTIIDQTYRIDRLIAIGGMGEVYQATNITTNKHVAIKFSRHDLSDVQLSLKYFEREINVISNNIHDAILRYQHDGYCQTLKRRYLVTDYLEGVTLKQKLNEGAFSLAETLALKQRLASALAHLHQRNIMHGDIASDNIMLPNGDISRAILIDCGACRLLGSEQIHNGITGRLRYCSPESVGLFQAPTTRSDIYSLGLLLSECLAPQSFDMTNDVGNRYADIRQKRCTLASLEGIDEHIKPLLRMMLRPDPKLRIASMQEVMAWRIAEQHTYAIAVDTSYNITPFKSLKNLVYKHAYHPQTIAASIGALMLLGTAGTLSATFLKDFDMSIIARIISPPEITEGALEEPVNIIQDKTIQMESPINQVVVAPEESTRPIEQQEIQEIKQIQASLPIIQPPAPLNNNETPPKVSLAAIDPQTITPPPAAPPKINVEAIQKPVNKKPKKIAKPVEEPEEETILERKKRPNKSKIKTPIRQEPARTTVRREPRPQRNAPPSQVVNNKPTPATPQRTNTSIIGSIPDL